MSRAAFGFLGGLVPRWVWALLLAGALAWAGAIAWRAGAANVQARWNAAELTRQQAEADARREDARIARAAAAEFEAWRADRQARRPEVARGLRNALSAPISPAAGQPLAAVLVPAAAVASLRLAGADSAAPGPAASGAGR